MPKVLGISIETEFIEFCCSEPGQTAQKSSQQRFKWNHKQITPEIESFLQSQNQTYDETHILGAPTLPFVLKGQVNCPALLTTAGMEHWLELQSISEKQIPSEFISFVNTHDRVFPIFERVNGNGTVEKSLQIEELEALHTKLEMDEIKTVCICLLNSSKNPNHEIEIANYFIDKGYKVFYSSQYKNVNDEVLRWTFALQTAFNSCLLEDDLESLLPHLPDSQIKVWNNSGLQSNDNVHGFGGLEEVITQWMSVNSKVSDMAFFGFDEFIFVSQNSESGSQPLISRFKVQPSSTISSSIWGKAMVDINAPMSSSIALSPSLRPNVLDLIISSKGSSSLPDTLQSVDRTKLNIKLQELLFSFSNQEQPSRGQIAEDKEALEESIFTFILDELVLSRISDDIYFAGPLAKTILNFVEKGKAPFNCRLLENADFFKSSIACSNKELAQ